VAPAGLRLRRWSACKRGLRRSRWPARGREKSSERTATQSRLEYWGEVVADGVMGIRILVLAAYALDGEICCAALRSRGWDARWALLAKRLAWPTARRRTGLALVLPGRVTSGVLYLLKDFAAASDPDRALLVLDPSDELWLSALAKVWPGGIVSRDQSLADLNTAVGLLSAGGRYVATGWRSMVTKAEAASAAMLGLTPRESQVMELLVNGLTLCEAATRLNIRYKTADAYRGLLFRKLGIRNRVQLVHLATGAYPATERQFTRDPVSIRAAGPREQRPQSEATR